MESVEALHTEAVGSPSTPDSPGALLLDKKGGESKRRLSLSPTHNDDIDEDPPFLEWLQEAVVDLPVNTATALWNGGTAVVEWIVTAFKKTTWSLSASPSLHLLATVRCIS